MKYSHPKVVIALATFLVITSCKKEISPISSEDQMSAALLATNRGSHTYVPIKGTYVTTNLIISPPPLLRQVITGVGRSSHLGEGTFVAQATLNVITNQISGTAYFTAANMDIFYTNFSGTGIPNPDGTRTVVVNHTISGGTGRFLNATGNLIGYTIGNPAVPAGLITYEGTIKY